MCKIVIIEDDIDICNMIKKFLENNKYSVQYALNGIEGINLCKSFVPDLIILDIMLPGLNGDDVLQKLRKFTNAPVIVVSAKTMVQTKIELLKIGADDYMTKPLKQLSLTLSTGEVFGFLGPNGAGKTTTVKLLTGVLSPSGGSCEIMGVNPNIQPEKVHLLAGIVTEHAQMYDNLTGIENLMFYAAAFGMEQKGKWRAESLLKELELTEAKDQKLATYSTGMRQRLSLARALLHHPKVLFLDEPTSGLDPESAQNVNQMIHNLACKEGITVFLCTHQLRYAQEICTRYGLIDQGILLASGTIDELRARVFTSKSLRICASAVPDKLNFVKCGINEFETQIQDKKEIPYLVRKIVEAGEDIYSVNLIEPTLEDIYFTLTAGRKED